MPDDYAARLTQLITTNEWLMQVLTAVRHVNPPDWLVGAGVIRNLVWDHLHGYAQPTPANDVDVAFFDPHDLTPARDTAVTQQLLARLPTMKWEATNQAAVHLWYEQAFGHAVPPLTSSADAIGTWPETATSIGVRLLPNDDLLIVAPCGLDDLFNLVLRRNPRRVSLARFHRRLRYKQILHKWPQVRLVDG